MAADIAQTPIVFGDAPLTIDDIIHISNGERLVSLSTDSAFIARLKAGHQFLDTLLEEEGHIYGVTTGYGDSCTVGIPLHLVNQLPIHLTRFHGCGLGNVLTEQQGLAVLATRLSSLSRGYSGVREELLQQLCLYINQRIIPRIPEEGSVGASGDLTPLSYVAATLIGEREVFHNGQLRPTAEVLKELTINPITLMPKEGLALMNGTSVMTALACLAYHRVSYLNKLAARITALCSLALKGNAYHFDDILFSVKPHPGQNQIAQWIRSDINKYEHPRNENRLQDRYSIRCAPHIIGVLQDSLPWMKQFIENELNSANDNPIIDGLGEHVLHGGHFYGGHIAFVMDAMKTGIANIADLLDRQLALLVDKRFNNGLASNLSGSSPERACINHGFKAVQIGVSAWTAEALKNTMPASVFSRSTECHNQDKVSMGTIAARDCLRVLQLTEQVTAACLLAVHQAMQLRINNQELEFNKLTPAVQTMMNDISTRFELVTEDRPLEQTLRHFIELIQQQHWSLYE